RSPQTPNAICPLTNTTGQQPPMTTPLAQHDTAQHPRPAERITQHDQTPAVARVPIDTTTAPSHPAPHHGR
ncbi:hypothetical protein, partial [Mycobacterium marinum]|uniref:hypothetical protein n=1 Tax=Mycobacterium marinum TaxID=1781 RepID=UPI001AA06B68